ncbi:hypothetical protein RI578_40635 (plasmid) [Streptomyces sp. BB1-1-1]|nr:hypothetical protein [Streptomyces sp. BB1-1-1]WND40601.1 hypothetical protein RI578_40635 [Streptomyces sp. BB1-1-1]
MTSTAQTPSGSAAPGAALPWALPGATGPRNAKTPWKGELRMS